VAIKIDVLTVDFSVGASTTFVVVMGSIGLSPEGGQDN
jgi:hypothetical protein